jgi:hypothetical protein
VGEILPGTAAGLGLTDELRLARLMATWSAIVAEYVPAASHACRVIGVEGRDIVIEADHPQIGQEIHLHEQDLLAGLSAVPGGSGIRRLRVRVGGPRDGTPL